MENHGNWCLTEQSHSTQTKPKVWSFFLCKFLLRCLFSPTSEFLVFVLSRVRSSEKESADTRWCWCFFHSRKKNVNRDCVRRGKNNSPHSHKHTRNRKTTSLKNKSEIKLINKSRSGGEESVAIPWRNWNVTQFYCYIYASHQLPNPATTPASPFLTMRIASQKKKESQLDHRAAKWSRIHDSNKKRSLGRWLPLGMAVGTRSTRRLIGRCFFSPLGLLQCEDRDVLIAIRRKWSNSPYHCCYSHS